MTKSKSELELELEFEFALSPSEVARSHSLERIRPDGWRSAYLARSRSREDLLDLLDRAGADYLVAESGPGGGRHVWAALAEPVDAETVAGLARLMRHLCPTLDLAPLTNPATGCVRPPGAPHRAGGASEVNGPTFSHEQTTVPTRH